MRYRRVNLDFHTSEHIPKVGEQFNKEQFQRALKLGHVNEITLFAKCHHGWSYYFTDNYPVHPTLSVDLLRLQIEAANEIGVSTVMYVSVGFDEKMAFEHPEWLAHAADNTIVCTPSFTEAGFHRMCFNSPYKDYVLGQIKEVLELFSPKDLFIDISSVQPCYCPSCLKRLRERGKSVCDLAAVKQLAEDVFFEFCHSITELIEEVGTNTTVFHNGGHILRGRRDLMNVNTRLEVESLPTGKEWGYDHFPISAAYMRSLGVEFAGMTGKFHSSWGDFGGYKHPNALRYEAALMLANGAYCTVGDQLHPSGEMDIGTYEILGKAYSEVEQKEPWCEESRFVADVAVLSYESVDCDNGGRSSCAQDVDTGAVRMLNEGNFLFDVIDTLADFSKYKVIILPDLIRVSPELFDKLKSYTENGGKLLASGMSGLSSERDEFLFNLGAEFKGECPSRPVYIEPQFELPNMPKEKFAIFSKCFLVDTANSLASLYKPYFNRTPDHFCSHMQTPPRLTSENTAITEGAEGIYLAWPVFTEYFEEGSICNREMVVALLNKLLGDNKTVECDMPAQGIVTLAKRQKHNDYILHILYASPVKRGKIQIIEDLIPLYDKSFKIKVEEEVKQVLLVPECKEVDFELKDGYVSFNIPRIDCHQMVELKF